VTSGPRRPLATALVVPCYDEASRLDGEAFLRFAAARPWLRFLFVDDGSRDRTRERLEELRRKAPEQVDVLALPGNRGKAEAVRRGLLAALDGRAALVGFWDADLATPLAELDGFVAQFEREPELEILLGSRVRLLGREIERRPLRHYLGRVAATAVSLLIRLPIYDTQCGSKLFRDTPTLRALLAEPFLTRWLFDVELIARWLDRRVADRARVGRHVREVPLHAWRDVAGTRIRLVDFLRVPLDLWRIRHRHRAGIAGRAAGPEARA
jgi:glycosyltransferase involved in cell wall biosynthesis